ncbi:MAG: sugar phosphate isomerase/epimerase, partial [Proteobacteria bacterium]|nr:sugar phosphate isomerase/epimerase [Pseudomonadota bacterium]
MCIAVKLGKKEEIESLGGYRGIFKHFEIPCSLLTGHVRLKDLIGKGFVFNAHGLVLPAEDEVGNFKRKTESHIDSCAQLGIQNLILHGAVKEDAKDNRYDEELLNATFKSLVGICEYAADRKVNCLLENGGYYSRDGVKYREITSLPGHHIALAERLGVGIVLDMGHLALSSSQNGYGLKEFISPYFEGDRSPEIIHFSDNFLEEDDHVAIGYGKADIDV